MGKLTSLKKYFLRYKGKLALGVLFILISNSAQVIIPLLLKESIELIQNFQNYDQLITYVIYMFGAALVAGGFRFLIRMTIIVVSREIEYDLRQDFWKHLQTLPLRFYQNNSTGSLMAHATNDINAVRMFLGPAVMYSIDTISKLVIILVIMFMLSMELTIYTLLPLPFLSYFVYKLSKKIHVRFMRIQEKFADLTTMAQENFAGIRVVKSYVREENEIAKFTEESKNYLDRNMDKVKIEALFAPILFIISGISIIIVVWAGGTMVINGKLTLGDISAFVIYLGMLIWPMIAFGWVVNIIQQASASMKRLGRIWDEEKEIDDSPDTDFSIKDINGKIEFKNVSFKYGPNLPYVLKNINLTINKGETVAFIGHTGSGKTTILNMIPRYYDVTEGEIIIDGKSSKTIPLSILRGKIGMVPQETFLFSDTIVNNIIYGAKKKDMETVEKAAEISLLKNDVDQFADGYDTILGERGITMSGGQKQRTCLARAIAVDPEILILDDSFSAVDTNTEETILNNLKGFMENRTSIIVSHRISTVKNADKIVVLKDGEIAESGTHDELVKLNGIYAELNFKQMLEEELKELN